jgi:hypothetical protein
LCRLPFSCPVIENFIWFEPFLRGHLSYEATISVSQKWHLNTGLTVPLALGRWFSPCTPGSSTNKIDCHDILDIVLKAVEYYEIKITSKSFAQKFELKWSLGGPLSKLCVTPSFSINFRCKIICTIYLWGNEAVLHWLADLTVYI